MSRHKQLSGDRDSAQSSRPARDSAPANAEEPIARVRPAVKKLLLTGFCIAMVFVALAFLAPVDDWLDAGLLWLGYHQHLAWPVFAVTCAIVTVFAMPGSLQALAAGFVFGLPAGLPVVSIGTTIGATVAFLIARFVARDHVQKKIAGSARFRALDAASRHDSLLIAFLVRLSPIFPFNVVNYLMGLSDVRFGHYVLGTWLGSLPALAVYVYAGSLASSLDSLRSGLNGSTSNRILLGVGLVITIVVVLLIARKTNHMLTAEMERYGNEP